MAFEIVYMAVPHSQPAPLMEPLELPAGAGGRISVCPSRRKASSPHRLSMPTHITNGIVAAAPRAAHLRFSLTRYPSVGNTLAYRPAGNRPRLTKAYHSPPLLRTAPSATQQTGAAQHRKRTVTHISFGGTRLIADRGHIQHLNRPARE